MHADSNLEFLRNRCNHRCRFLIPSLASPSRPVYFSFSLSHHDAVRQLREHVALGGVERRFDHTLPPKYIWRVGQASGVRQDEDSVKIRPHRKTRRVRNRVYQRVRAFNVPVPRCRQNRLLGVAVRFRLIGVCGDATLIASTPT